jgi:hypothetical protein
MTSPHPAERKEADAGKSRRGRKPLNAQTLARRRRAKNRTHIERLERRLDKYVERAETCKVGSKTRALWLAKADDARERLKTVDH